MNLLEELKEIVSNKPDCSWPVTDQVAKLNGEVVYIANSDNGHQPKVYDRASDTWIYAEDFCDYEYIREIRLLDDISNQICFLERLNKRMRLLPASEWHEDLGSSIFVSFFRDENGQILGEPPELEFCSGYTEDGFDPEKWTHYIDGDFNFMFSDADPVNFPIRK